jgi:hypothetical protein
MQGGTFGGGLGGGFGYPTGGLGNGFGGGGVGGGAPDIGFSTGSGVLDDLLGTAAARGGERLLDEVGLGPQGGGQNNPGPDGQGGQVETGPVVEFPASGPRGGTGGGTTPIPIPLPAPGGQVPQGRENIRDRQGGTDAEPAGFFQSTQNTILLGIVAVLVLSQTDIL